MSLTPTKTRERNRRGEGLRLRQDIVQAAANILNAGGSAASVSLRDIARQVGISAPSIYTHFPDRDSIVLAVVQDTFVELKDRLETQMNRPGLEAVARLRAVCVAYLDFALEWPQRYQILFGGVWNLAEAQKSSSVGAVVVGDEVFALMVEAIAQCVVAGQSSSTDPAADASALWVALHGLADLRVTAPLFPWPPDLVELLINRLALLNPTSESPT